MQSTEPAGRPAVLPLPCYPPLLWGPLIIPSFIHLGTGQGRGDPLMNKMDKTPLPQATPSQRHGGKGQTGGKGRPTAPRLYANQGAHLHNLGQVRRQRAETSCSPPSPVFLDPQSFSRIWASLKMWEISQTSGFTASPENAADLASSPVVPGAPAQPSAPPPPPPSRPHLPPCPTQRSAPWLCCHTHSVHEPCVMCARLEAFSHKTNDSSQAETLRPGDRAARDGGRI